MATSNPVSSPFMPPAAGPSSASKQQRGEHIDDVDENIPQRDVLTSHWSPDRLSRPPTLPSASTPQHRPVTKFTIQSRQNNYISNNGQHVRPVNSVSGLSNTSSPSIQDGHLATPIESTLPHPSPSHGSLNTFSNRPRSSYPVFNSTSDLAAHHGIPRKLPPLPNTSHRPTVPTFRQPAPPSHLQEPVSPDYSQNLISNYLDMLSKKPEDTLNDPASAASASAMDIAVDDSTAAQNIVQSLFATPEWNDFLTSPFDESPFDNVLETPLQDSAELDAFLTSPVVTDAWNPDSFGDFPLFPQTSDPSLELSKMSVSMATQSSLPTPDFDGLIAMSPYTPSLDPQTLYSSPQIHSGSPASLSSTRPTRKLPTGTRKNISPESLVPVEAPTQPRSYVTPSATSRKELPAVFAKKRARSMAFDDEEDELVEEARDPNALPPTETEAEAIAAKRRQNTLAARRSRKRKLEYQRQLEDEVEKERKEKEVWKQRALFCRDQLQRFGVPAPFHDE